MSAASARESEQPTPAWKIRNSLWVFMCVGTFGLAAPWIILYVAVASRRPAWMAFGAGLAAASITSMVWLSGAAIWQREASDWLLMAVWLGGSAFAAGANREYLRIKWAARKDVNAAFPASASAPARRTRGGSAKTSRTGTPAGRQRGKTQGFGRVSTEAAAHQSGPGPDGASTPPRSRQHAPQPQAGTPAAAKRGAWQGASSVQDSVPGPGPGPAHSQTPRAPGGLGPVAAPNAAPGSALNRELLAAGAGPELEPVEVNGASAEAFAALPGFDAELAARAVSLRQGRPYVSVEQFAERLALQPHVFLRIRNRLSCRVASVQPGLGRRVDY
ncbi:helix-hairpin-helix domain-containing protein [Arthrobacter sp. Sa2CUA1]|uniref:Helix-hairpin-helix domain-containing protein n=1 Tax=Arthrobacter gallicola TaxID=2762225 RepID=A0ABR8UW09_9MICC|nr:helix-hairpin-helix domain-containing protein [Arthrobacter gallicola]MBD7996746.1 helix-hairpin-helix domain-containing protein [Arthrobacter gallicola]